ncbi:transmembrane and coiled-coil domain-containing protein 3-like isoform X2 [Corticium candelabrum]|uniref:transmembrane and coiled-coil domain-containing protein 3-like isoform X2 n=1 Tax=Corticium candelabrum TaxID=121492 RepID=UPI002E268BDB|nr:transmembrane and coiled-coil domain-containing protein 3-like isoform X2 [Corticium candelabrum]
MHSILLLCFLIGFCVVSTLPEKKNQAFNIWTASSCQQVTTLLRTKSGVLQKLKKNVVEIQKSLKLSEEEKKTRLSVLNIFSDELDASESSIFSSLMALRAALKGNFRSLDELKRSSTRRLDALKAAAVQEEERFNAILEAEKHGFELKNAKLKNQHLNHSSVAEKFLDEMLAEVAEAADKLELSLQENVFESVAKSKDVELETVVKIPEHLVQRGNETYHDHHEGEDDEVIRLVDSQSNQYILTKAKDSTVPHEDHYFIHDLIYLLLTCCVLGLLCSKLGIPTMFGYVLSGVLFGPSGLGAITAVVQVETIGEFGVYFMLFVVGLEFSPGKLRKVLIIAVTGSIAIVILMICGGLIVGYLVGIHQLQSSFVAACLSLSSTPLVVKFMQQSSTHLILPTKGHNSDTSEVGSTLVGLLVMQDTQLALIIAILPSLATNVVGTDSDIHTSSPSTENTISTAVMFTLLSLVGLVLSSFILSKLLMIAITRQAFRLENREICLLFALLSCLLALVITDRANMCMELGCFLAGLVVSSQSKEFYLQCDGTCERHVFCSLFCIYWISHISYVSARRMANAICFDILCDNI